MSESKPRQRRKSFEEQVGESPASTRQAQRIAPRDPRARQS